MNYYVNNCQNIFTTCYLESILQKFLLNHHIVVLFVNLIHIRQI